MNTWDKLELTLSIIVAYILVGGGLYFEIDAFLAAAAVIIVVVSCTLITLRAITKISKEVK